ncbi:MAG: TonB-dependent receptor [Bacteroidetes bacterium]|nr:TonB-dependent receptor [Bacteroidota bacterium]
MKKIFYTVTALAGFHYGMAQKDSVNTNQLNEVIITAAKTNLKQSQTGKIVTVLDQQTIANNIGRSLSELLNTQAGFFLNGANNTHGTNIDAYFRGSATGNLLIVIDGIPVFDPSQPNNSFDLNSIPLDQIEKIEILKGGQSTLWGSDAVAGVVQIFLKKDWKKKIAANANVAYGSYNTLNAGAGINGAIDRFAYNLQYNYLKTDGISAAYDSTGKQNFDKDGFKRNNFRGELRYAITKNLNVKAIANLSIYHNDLDEGAFTDDKDYTAKNVNNLGALYFNYHKENFSWNLLGSYQQAKRSFVDDSTDISSPYYKYAAGKYIGNTLTVETFGNIHLAKHFQLVSGVQYIHQQTDQFYKSYSDFGPYESDLGKDSARINQVSVYTSLLITDVHGFNFEAGGRVNNHSIYGNNATYTLNPSININEHVKLFLNISSAYKIPSLYQLYSEYGNRDLKPESSTTYELGVQGETNDKTLFFRVAAFKRDTRNLIIFFTDTTTFASKYINRDKQNDYGFELESTVQLGKIGSWNNNFAYVHGRGEQDNVKMDNLFRRPNFTWNSALALQPVKQLTIAPSLRVIGTRLKAPYDIGPDKMPSYYTVDCLLAYKINHVRFFAEFHNITNQQYFDIVGYNTKRFNMLAGVYLNF